jgi:hypothetical protein
MACADDKTALENIYGQEAPWLLRAAYRIACQLDIADYVIQDAFIQVWHEAHSFDSYTAGRWGWIYMLLPESIPMTVMREIVEVRGIAVLLLLISPARSETFWGQERGWSIPFASIALRPLFAPFLMPKLCHVATNLLRLFSGTRVRGTADSWKSPG